MSPPVEWQADLPASPGDDDHNRCFDSRVGGSLWANSDRRQVVSGREGASYQLPRAVSCLSGPANICSKQTSLPHCDAPGQHHSNFLYQAQRRNSHSQSVSASNPDVEVVYGSHDHTYSIPRTRERQHDCGFPLQEIRGQTRVDAPPTSVCSDMQSVVIPPKHRPIRFEVESSGPALRGLETGSGGGGDKCFLSELDERTSICISALLSLASGTEESADRPSNSSGNSPYLANSNVVPNVTRAVSCATSHASSVGGHPDSATLRRPSPIEQVPSSSGMACMRRQYEEKGFSAEVIEVLLESCRSSTRKQYQSAWGIWCGWCRERFLDPVSAPLKDILAFLVACEKKGLSYNTLGVYRSAISLYHKRIGGVAVGQCDDVSRLIKAFFIRNPPKPKYAWTWEVEPVISFLRGIPPWRVLSLKMLTLKTVLLLGLVTLGRVSSLVYIDIDLLSVSDSCLKFIPSKLYKQSRPGHGIKSTTIQSFEDKQLCPVQAVKEYLRATKKVRGAESQLFISHISPHKKVVSSTISRWMLDILGLAGVDTEKFKAHSSRGAAASCSLKLGVAMRDILETAGWYTNSTFSQFYHRPSATSNGCEGCS